MHVLAFQSSVMFLLVSLLFVSSAEGGPEQIPQHLVWALFGALGHLLVSPWTLFGTKTKKETKSDMEDPRFGVQVGTQNPHFSGKSGTKHKKMGSQTGSGKKVLS